MKNGDEYTPTAPSENTRALTARLEAVRERIRAAEARFARRPDSTGLLAVSKRQEAEAVQALFACGQRAFGESYAQEALAKQRALAALPVEWHFIGPIQSNKTRAIAEHFAWVHSVDRLALAERLDAQRPTGTSPLQICLQVNISAEASKRGVAPAATAELAARVRELPNLRLRGLMTIPAPADDFVAQREPFRKLRELWEGLRARGFELDTLSMGMSDDLEAAVAEGSTLVRVGTALFGPRPGSA